MMVGLLCTQFVVRVFKSTGAVQEETFRAESHNANNVCLSPAKHLSVRQASKELAFAQILSHTYCIDHSRLLSSRPCAVSPIDAPMSITNTVASLSAMLLHLQQDGWIFELAIAEDLLNFKTSMRDSYIFKNYI